jgi:hypothetical protein
MTIVIEKDIDDIVPIDDFDEDTYKRFMDNRGGCSCNHPPYAPPCSACVNPLTLDELEDLEIELKPPEKFKGQDHDLIFIDELEEQNDGDRIMDVTRRMFR